MRTATKAGVMRELQFAFRVDGIDIDDDRHLDALGGHPEVQLVTQIGDVTLVHLVVTAASGEAAVRAGVHLVEGAVPGATVESIDFDLVAATDVAERAGVTRQSVSQWVASGRRGESFPAPLGAVAGGTRVWLWAEVLPWLQSTGSDLGDETTLSPTVMTEMNALLSHSRLPGRVPV